MARGGSVGSAAGGAGADGGKACATSAGSGSGEKSATTVASDVGGRTGGGGVASGSAIRNEGGGGGGGASSVAASGPCRGSPRNSLMEGTPRTVAGRKYSLLVKISQIRGWLGKNGCPDRTSSTVVPGSRQVVTSFN